MKTPVIIPVSGKSNVEIVVEQLEKLIAENYWEPEDRIWSESEISAKFNVGRSTVREAVNMLKAKNLLYTVPGLGTFVSKAADVDDNFVLTRIPDPKSETDLGNIMELRLGLEPVNAAFAARRATPEDIAALRAAHAKLTAAMDAPTDAFAVADMEFHIRIAQASQNAIALDVMNLVTSFFREQQLLTSHQISRRLQSLNFHEQLLAAIAGQAADDAEKIMRSHMEETYSHVKSLITRSKRISGRLEARREGK